MSLPAVNHPLDHITVSTTMYEGPLDLLLDLIEKAELDITSIALAQVTDQYLDYLKNLQKHDLAEISAFLVIAAKLIQIKSEALLPRPPEREPGEEDPGLTLAQMLIVYRRYKQIAAWLGERVNHNLRTYLRLASPIHYETKVDLEGITLDDLFLLAKAVHSGDVDLELLDTVVSIPLITIKEKMNHIIQQIKLQSEITFHQAIEKKTDRVDVIVTFLAILELIKRQLVIVEQDTLFADITLHPDEAIINLDNFSEDIEE